MTGVGLGKGHLKPVASQEGSEGDRRIRVASERLAGEMRSVCLRAQRARVSGAAATDQCEQRNPTCPEEPSWLALMRRRPFDGLRDRRINRRVLPT